MRILINSQPKTGNVWLRNLLASIYDLSDLNEALGERTPESVPEFVAYFNRHRLDDDVVFHQHFFPREELIALSQQQACKLVTIVRNPYEAFVSFIFYVNKMEGHFRDRPLNFLIGKEFDDPVVLEFLAGKYRVHLNMSAQWVKSGKSHIVRYEELLREPALEMKVLTNKIGPVPEQKITKAVAACDLGKFKKKGKWQSAHVRSAKEKTWDQYLTEEHLAIFRKRYSGLIRTIGYEVE